MSEEYVDRQSLSLSYNLVGLVGTPNNRVFNFAVKIYSGRAKKTAQHDNDVWSFSSNGSVFSSWRWRRSGSEGYEDNEDVEMKEEEEEEEQAEAKATEASTVCNLK